MSDPSQSHQRLPPPIQAAQGNPQIMNPWAQQGQQNWNWGMPPTAAPYPAPIPNEIQNHWNFPPPPSHFPPPPPPPPPQLEHWTKNSSKDLLKLESLVLLDYQPSKSDPEIASLHRKLQRQNVLETLKPVYSAIMGLALARLERNEAQILYYEDDLKLCRAKRLPPLRTYQRGKEKAVQHGTPKAPPQPVGFSGINQVNCGDAQNPIDLTEPTVEPTDDGSDMDLGSNDDDEVEHLPKSKKKGPDRSKMRILLYLEELVTSYEERDRPQLQVILKRIKRLYKKTSVLERFPEVIHVYSAVIQLAESFLRGSEHQILKENRKQLEKLREQKALPLRVDQMPECLRVDERKMIDKKFKVAWNSKATKALDKLETIVSNYDQSQRSKALAQYQILRNRALSMEQNARKDLYTAVMGLARAYLDDYSPQEIAKYKMGLESVQQKRKFLADQGKRHNANEQKANNTDDYFVNTARALPAIPVMPGGNDPTENVNKKDPNAVNENDIAAFDDLISPNDENAAIRRSPRLPSSQSASTNQSGEIEDLHEDLFVIDRQPKRVLEELEPPDSKRRRVTRSEEACDDTPDIDTTRASETELQDSTQSNGYVSKGREDGSDSIDVRELQWVYNIDGVPHVEDIDDETRSLCDLGSYMNVNELEYQDRVKSLAVILSNLESSTFSRDAASTLIKNLKFLDESGVTYPDSEGVSLLVELTEATNGTDSKKVDALRNKLYSLVRKRLGFMASTYSKRGQDIDLTVLEALHFAVKPLLPLVSKSLHAPFYATEYLLQRQPRAIREGADKEVQIRTHQVELVPDEPFTPEDVTEDEQRREDLLKQRLKLRSQLRANAGMTTTDQVETREASTDHREDQMMKMEALLIAQRELDSRYEDAIAALSQPIDESTFAEASMKKEHNDRLRAFAELENYYEIQLAEKRARLEQALSAREKS